MDDCGDRSDELGCRKLTFDEQKASKNSAISCATFFFGIDAKGSCEGGNNTKSLCAHACAPLGKTGYLCTCNHGYQVNPSNPKKCEDVNECESLSANNCSQTCVNLKGSFNCSCHEDWARGFGNDPTCRPKDYTPTPVILLSNGGEIYKISRSEIKVRFNIAVEMKKKVIFNHAIV